MSKMIIRSLQARSKIIAKQITSLEAESTKLDAAISALTGTSAAAVKATKPAKKRRMSAAGRAAIIAGAKKRWAKHNKAKAAARPARKKSKMSAAGRAAIAAAQKARWAKIKAEKGKVPF